MNLHNQFRNARQYYSENGVVRTMGIAVRSLGCVFNSYCQHLCDVRRENREYDFPLLVRIRAGLGGFNSKSYYLLDIKNRDADDYLNNNKSISDINYRYSDALSYKHTFTELSKTHFEHLPAVLWHDKRGETRSDTVSELLSVVQNHGTVVVKPDAGSSGNGVKILRFDGETYYIDGSVIQESDIFDAIRYESGTIVTEYIRPHQYASNIFGESLNTLRVFTLIDPETNEPEVIRAAHRFGSSQSAPTDNLGRGAYCAPIDISTGKIKQLISVDGSGRSISKRHPDSGEVVEGVRVPNWEQVVTVCCKFADLHSPAPLIGWDVAIDKDGRVVIIEGNSGVGINLLQLEEGILTNESVKQILQTGRSGKLVAI